MSIPVLSGIGNALDAAGTALKLPELGLSETFNGGQPTANTGKTASSIAGGFTPSPTPGLYGGNFNNVSYAPQSGPAFNPTQAYGSGGLTSNTPTAPSQQVLSASSSAGGQSDQQKWAAAGHAGTAPVGYHGEAGPQGIDPAAINAAYDPQFQYLNDAETNVRNDYPNVLKEAQGNYDVNKAQLDTGNQTAMDQFGQQADQATQRNLDATSANSRLYSDLNTGYQQRFGGLSSAGQYASAIANEEQQRQQGQLSRGFADTQRTIEQQRQAVQSSYQNNLLQLNQQKQTALDQANRDFQNKLLDISKSRADIGTAKAQANLSALQELRNQVFAINQQNTQFQQTLEAQTNQAHLQLQNYQAMVGAGQGASAQALSGYNSMASVNPQSNLQVGGGMQQAPSQYSGQISSQNGIKYDQYGNPISG